MNGFPLLSLITFLPVLASSLLFMVDRENVRVLKGTAFFVTILNFAISLALLSFFDSSQGGMQLAEQYAWVPKLGISYHIGIDGISLPLVLLATFLMPVCILCSWNAIDSYVREYLISFLVLETAMLGALLALDLVLFYVFWEFMLIPMYFIIGAWGGKRRIYATVKFVLYTLFGSVLMLASIIYLYFSAGAATGEYTFELSKLLTYQVPHDVQMILFAGFALSFLVKVPVFPFHTWLPDAHVEAPTAGSVILAGVLLKMGTYGFLRFGMGLFPEAATAAVPFIQALALIGIIYGALVAFVQPDVKKLVAYSSVSHMGAIMLGLVSMRPEGIEGAIFQMVHHGISTGGLFLMIGMVYERRHTRLIADYGGIAKTMPVFAAFFLVVTLSSIGMPALSGFPGEFLILAGAFKSNMTVAAIAATGVILSAAYMLTAYQKVMLGPITHEENKHLDDMTGRELTIIIPIVALYVLLGFFPNALFTRTHASVDAFLARYHTRVASFDASATAPAPAAAVPAPPAPAAADMHHKAEGAAAPAKAVPETAK